MTDAALRRNLYLTFGTQYVTPEEWDVNGHRGDPHPLADWATGAGYLTVEYGISHTDIDDDEALADRRERARQAAWYWLEGKYAFEYNEPPKPDWCPAGEIARMVLP